MADEPAISRRTCCVRAALFIGAAGFGTFGGCNREGPGEPAKPQGEPEPRKAVAKAPDAAVKPSDGLDQSADRHHMRLTLRTLLAYRDRILKPVDQVEIGEKLRQSAFATELNARIDKLLETHQDDIAILNGKQLQDAIDVAEYLDNVMDGAKVKPFEKSALESDAELAELASCHNLMATFLENPSQVAPEEAQQLRKRAYQVPVIDEQSKH